MKQFEEALVNVERVYILAPVGHNSQIGLVAPFIDKALVADNGSEIPGRVRRSNASNKSIGYHKEFRNCGGRWIRIGYHIPIAKTWGHSVRRYQRCSELNY